MSCTCRSSVTATLFMLAKIAAILQHWDGKFEIFVCILLKVPSRNKHHILVFFEFHNLRERPQNRSRDKVNTMYEDGHAGVF